MLVAKKKFMVKCINIAKKSASKGDYAVGALIVKDDEIIATGETLLNRSTDATMHAEIVAIRKACKKLNSRILEGCILYTTHEPCPMCASAAIWAKMDCIVFGATYKDAKDKATKKFSWRQINIPCKYILSKGQPKVKLVEKFMRKECNELFSFSDRKSVV